MDFDSMSNEDRYVNEDKHTNRLYNLLYSLVEALSPDIARLNLRDGSGERLNRYIDELVQATHDAKLDDFKVEIRRDHKGNNYSFGEAYSRQLIGIVKYLYKTNDSISYYCMALSDIKLKSGIDSSSTTINNHLNADQSQDNQQTTTVTIEFTQTIVLLTEALTNLERDFPDTNSKENQFAKVLKDKLPTVKSTLDIMSLVLKIAGQVGLDPQNVLKLLNLS